MRQQIIEEYPSVKDLEVVLKNKLSRKESQEFLKEEMGFFVHTGSDSDVAKVGSHLLYDIDSLIRLKRKLSARNRNEKSTAFVVESLASLDEIEGDLKRRKQDAEVFDNDSNLTISDTKRSENAVRVEISYTHRKENNRNLMDARNRTTSFKIKNTNEDNIFRVDHSFFNADEFTAAKNLFGEWDRRRQISGESSVSRADISLDAIPSLEDRVDFFDDFLTYNPGNWDLRNVSHLGVRQDEDPDESDELDSTGEFEDLVDNHLSNIKELALTGQSVRENKIVEKCIENGFYFDSAKIYCENTERARGVEITLRFKEKGRNAFDLSITGEYELVSGGKNEDPFGLQFRKTTRHKFRDAVVDLYGEYKDMPDLIEERGETFSFQDLPDIGSTIEGRLKEVYGSVSDVIAADIEELQEIDGIGPATAKRIKALQS
ncbi:helix-hairpin-helix domain-containing protein [Salinigranum halophilum]|uniref:helix-hairpin-helix domain-containing protein n=1 Tax=Salinigranum halophilum TaxID=2565931 RepID=UPI00115CE38B|nr:helix-hairpin-helix domain-containing protein [Salinigranum halophilum]